MTDIWFTVVLVMETGHACPGSRYTTDLLHKPTQDDLYVVYLVQEDYSGVYLSLNQDVPMIRRVYGSHAKDALAARAWDCIARLGQINEPYIIGPIDLKVTSASSLDVFYEQGSICAKYYKRGEIPNDEILSKDLKDILSLYVILVTKDHCGNIGQPRGRRCRADP